MTLKIVIYLIACAGFMACGLSTGAQIYYMTAFALIALMAVSLISVIWALFTVSVDMKGLRSRVYRGETLTAIFTATHRSLLPVSSVRLTLSVPSAFSPHQEISVPASPFSKKVFRHRITCPHRGVFEAGIERITVTDLFGLISLSRKSGMRLLRVDVFPNVAKCSPMELKSGDIGPETFSRSDEDTASPSDVRLWQEGDPLKKVHWKLSMRKREVMVRVYEESARPDTLIIPDLTNINAMRDQALSLEDAICEACAGMAEAQLQAGYPVRMPLTSRVPSEISGQFPQDIHPFVDALMRVRFDSPYEYEQVLMQMQRRMSRTGGAVIVTANLSTRIADLAARMQSSGVRVRVVWVNDSPMEASLEMAERLRMENVDVVITDPWAISEPSSAA